MFKKNLFIIRSTIVFVLIGLISIPVTGISGEKGGCSYQGSWYGFYSVNGTLGWTANVLGQSQSSGTTNLEVLYYDLTLNGLFPNAVKISALRGTWVRIGGNTFRSTEIGFAVDGEGETLWIGKLNTRNTLSDDCNTEFVDEGTLDFFDPEQDPFTGVPLFSIPTEPHYGYRMRVDFPD